MFYYVCRVDSLSLCFTKKNERSTGPSPTPPGRCHCMDGELASTVEVGSVICPLCYVSSSPVHKYLRNQKAFNNSINIIFMKILSIDILNVFWPISSEIQTRKARGQAHPLRWPTKNTHCSNMSQARIAAPGAFSGCKRRQPRRRAAKLESL